MTAAADVGLWPPVPPGLTIRWPKLVLPSLRDSVRAIVAGPLYRALGPLAIANTKPFLPTDLPGLVLWLAADKITGLSDGDPVTTWADASGLGNDATQATAAKKPIWIANGQNGRPVVRFDGVDDGMTTSTTFSFSDFSIFVVFKDNLSATSYERLVDHQYQTGFWMGREEAVVNSWGGGVQEIPFPYGRYMTLSDQAAHVLVSIRAGTTHSLFGDSVAGPSATVSGVATTSVGIGVGVWVDDSPTQRLGGDIAEILVYDRALAAANRVQVEQYCNSRWAVY